MRLRERDRVDKRESLALCVVLHISNLVLLYPLLDQVSMRSSEASLDAHLSVRVCVAHALMLSAETKVEADSSSSSSLFHPVPSSCVI